MNTKNINCDKIMFEFANNYDEFGISLLNINYSYELGDFFAFVELHGDLNVIGYAIVYGFNDEGKNIDAFYNAKQYKIAKASYLEHISENMD